MSGAGEGIEEDWSVPKFGREFPDLRGVMRNKMHLDHQPKVARRTPALRHLRVSHVAVADRSRRRGGSPWLMHLVDSQCGNRAIPFDQFSHSLWGAAIDRIEEARGSKKTF